MFPASPKTLLAEQTINSRIDGHGYLSFQESAWRPNSAPRFGNFLIDDESSSELISIILREDCPRIFKITML
jgi:hypothetical protein